MKKLLSLLLLGLAFQMQAQVADTARLDLHVFKSDIFQNERYLRVYLPPGYHQSKEKYRVLYLQDGQNLFDAALSPYSHAEWRVDETLDSLTRAGAIEPVIVVGIDNTPGMGRANEYLPWRDSYFSEEMPEPRGKEYPDFLLREVMPFIEQRYRVLTGPENTGIGGSSYGGLISLYTVLSRPNVFGFALIESPSLYVNDQAILLEIEARTKPVWPPQMFLAIGTNEMARPDCNERNETNFMAVADVEMLHLLLQHQGAKDVRLEVEKCAIHSETAWARRLPKAMAYWLGKE